MKECEELEDNEDLLVDEKNNTKKETEEKDVMTEVIGERRCCLRHMSRRGKGARR